MGRIKIAYTIDPEIGEMFIDLSRRRALVSTNTYPFFEVKNLSGDYDPGKNRFYREGLIEEEYFTNLESGSIGVRKGNLKAHIKNEILRQDHGNRKGDEQKYGRGLKPGKRPLTKKYRYKRR